MEFGEVLESTSRAFWDEFDDAQATSGEDLSLEWVWSAKKDLPNVGAVVVIEGCDVLAFASSVFHEKLELCKLPSGRCRIFYCEKSKTIFCVSEEVNLSLSGRITEFMFPWLEQAGSITVVSIQPKAFYKSDDPEKFEECTLVKTINTLSDAASTLEPPNFISGICAGVATWGYLRDILVCCHVVYINSIKLDEKSIAPVRKVLEKFGLKCDETHFSRLRNESHLYM